MFDNPGRFHPPHAPGQSNIYAIDYANILPPGAGLTSGAISIVTNTNPVQPTSDFSTEPVIAQGRRLYCAIAGGTGGTDYQLRFVATDSTQAVWPRTFLLLCAQTG